MRNRTKARECALKVLYASEITKDEPKVCADIFWQAHETIKEEVRSFAMFIVEGVHKNRTYVDSVITKYAKNWQIKRMATIDRNILRIATFELLFAEEVPPKVAINEAIEMAKKYGDKDSGKFVNGVLDKISKTEKK